MKVLGVVHARLGSTRLPRKILADIEGLPMLLRVWQRVTRLPIEWVIQIPDEDTSELGPLFGEYGVTWTAGPLEPLARLVSLAHLRPDAAGFMRVTADCPLWCAQEGQRVLDALGSRPYAHNLGPSTDGTDAEVMTRWALALANRDSRPDEREHVTPALRRLPVWTERVEVPGPPVHLSVDTAEDLERVRAIYRGGEPGTWAQIVGRWV